MNTPNPNDARLSGQSAAGSAKEMTDAEKVAVVEKAKGMFASDDWVLGLALSKAEPEKRVEVVKVFTDLLEKKAALNTEGYQCEICQGWVPPGAHTCPECGTW